MDPRKQIFTLLSASDYVPLHPAELAAKLSGVPQPEALRVLAGLVKTGELVAIKNGRLCLPRDADLVVGRIRFRQSGNALLLVEGGDEPISINAEDTFVALHDDKVVARLVAQTRPRRFRMGARGKAEVAEKEKFARVIRILERARTRLTGTLEREKLVYHVIPDDPRIVRNILVEDPKRSKIEPPPRVGDKVVVELREWKQRHLNPQGALVEVLGRSHEPRTEHAALFVNFGLQKDFPAAVEAEAERVGAPVTQAQCGGRLDLRDKPVFTIDPDDAKDFDDALHLERLSDGRIRVGIHIADVSAYVRPNSALDREAQRRGNSTYLVGEVVPMLPHALSSGVCSLKEGEDRLTKSVLVTFSKRGELEGVEFANTVIRSLKRLTYKQAKAFLDEDDFQKIRALPQPPAHQTGFAGRPLKALSNNEMHLLQSHIRELWSLARRMRSARMKAGSLDLDMPEVKIYVDKNGYPDRIERVEQDESHQLIEEFMLLANQEVARALNRQHIAAIHRTHDKPEALKLDELREALLTMGLRVGDLTQPREVSRFLEMTRAHPKGVYLRTLFLRSLKQACYRASPDGHYGLAMANYTHFTSPIRRYADFIVHRIFDFYLFKNSLPTAPAKAPPVYNVAMLQGIAEHISLTEQNSTEAERTSVKNRLLEFFEIESKKEPKSRFEASITEVKNHGVFVELTQSMAFGFIHVSHMESDFYFLDESAQALVGRRTGKRYGVGDRVQVEVEKVDRFKRQIDFVFAATDSEKPARVPQKSAMPSPKPRGQGSFAKNRNYRQKRRRRK